MSLNFTDSLWDTPNPEIIVVSAEAQIGLAATLASTGLIGLCIFQLELF